MNNIINKTYDPKLFEDKIYKLWINNGCFTPHPDETKLPYTIVMPPPNITGKLHMGHALNGTIQDIIIRFKRMQGYCTLWLPGTDHASIATEAKIVESLSCLSLTKEDVGKKEFLKKSWEWKNKFGAEITDQLKKLGFSCDWSRERFTLDDGCSLAVTKTFVDLYNKGLIYKGEKIINWCVNCLTSISDAEVEHTEKNSKIWHIKYKIKHLDEFIEIATTRPETMLGDTAIAVNPNDKRYQHMIGKLAVIPIINREIPIIADNYVDIEFGTGAVKITPAHDINDFEVGLRHSLPIINVMNDNGTINEHGLKYFNLERYDARKEIIKDLKKINQLVDIKPHNNKIGECYRCSTIIEPRLSKQWFVKMKPLATPAINIVKSNNIKFIPDRFNKTYFHWLENIKDWCISRQLWWGHTIPAYYCSKCDNIIVSENTQDKCPKCNSNMLPDQDTLDTWFSSALWPFSTLGWPENTQDLNYFYPTSTLVTGYDIIFFWVARMIFSALEHTNTPPFKNILIHGIVRDEDGKKMSKSLGNGVDPLKIIDEHGADALRLMLANGNSPGNDMRFSIDKVISSRNFVNKLWNATRFILMNTTYHIKDFIVPDILTMEDKWVLSKLNEVIKKATLNLNNFEIGVALSNIYDFIWDVFCSWYIEIAKTRLDNNNQICQSCQKILIYILSNVLKLLHPYIPFVTEEIWEFINYNNNLLINESWPEYNNNLNYVHDQSQFQNIIDAIKAIRNARTQMNVPTSKKTSIYINSTNNKVFQDCMDLIKKLAYASDVIMINENLPLDKVIQIVTNSATILIPTEQLIDKTKELEKLNLQKEKCLQEIEFISSKLNNKNFSEKAPKQIVEKEKEKLTKEKETLNQIEKTINNL